MYTWIDVSVSLTVTLCCASDAVETAAMKITMLEMVLRIVVTSRDYIGEDIYLIYYNNISQIRDICDVRHERLKDI